MTSSRSPIIQVRMLPTGSSASFTTASNCMVLLQHELGLEDGHRLATDPHARQVVAGKFELHFDPPGAMQGVPLDPGEARALAAALEQPESRQVGAEQTVGVAAHRVFRDAQCRAEHARLGKVVARVGGEREY